MQCSIRRNSIAFVITRLLSWKKTAICFVLICTLILFHLQYHSNVLSADYIRPTFELQKSPPIGPSPSTSSMVISSYEYMRTGTGFDSYGMNSGYLVNSLTCKIRDISPFDSSIIKYIKKAPKIDCNIFRSVTKTNGKFLLFYPHKLPAKYHHQFSNNSNFPNFPKKNKSVKASRDIIKCCYKAVFRVTQPLTKYNKKCDDVNRYSDKCYPILLEKQVVPFEIIKVECHERRTQIYSNVHAIMDKEKMLKASGLNTTPSDESPLNVIIFGTDSVSRLNMHRSLPLTVQYLKDELNAFEMYGHNKVGLNSVPNLFPLLTSKSREELKRICMPTSGPTVFDKCNHLFMWSLFKEKGYYTSYIEDFPSTALFNFNIHGFVNPPTNNYGRPFFLESQKIKKQHSICTGNKMTIQVLHDYSIELLTTLKDYPTFSYFYTSEVAHNDLNMVKLADKPNLSYLKRLKKNGILNNTILFFMSDHGLRVGDIRNTYIGSLEESLPMLFVVLPEWFAKKYPISYANLKLNTNKLTSHFDTHETLIDILQSSFEQPTDNRSTRGNSMFNNIAHTRTCKDAGIPDNYCNCQEMVKVPTSEDDIQTASTLVRESINTMVKPHVLCHPFEKDLVSSAYVGSRKEIFFKKDNVKNMRIYLTLNPGNANFEATVQKDITGNQTFKIIGLISRINRYFNQMNCTSSLLLRNYCVCNL